ncbi:MAG: AraC family transcriptional regulator ligand-binding domain-containing protein [Arenimonas sp.]
MNSPTTTSITSRFLVGILDDANVNADDILKAAGLSRDALSSPDCRMPLLPFRELWARAAMLQPDIGLRMVDAFPEGQMHILAHLAMRCANVGAALEALCSYASIASSADFMTCENHGPLVRFSYEHRTESFGNPWIVEHYFSMIMVFLTRATGKTLPIRKIEFMFPAQAVLDAYKHRFGLVPLFNSSHNSIEFDAAIFGWPLLTRDQYMYGILDKVVKSELDNEKMPRAASTSLREKARREIVKTFLLGSTSSIEAVARECGCSVKIFRERLSLENTTFRHLLDEARRDLAGEHLGSGLSVNETAYLLGFSEPSAFQHACKRWFDKSAGELRKGLMDISDKIGS